MRRGALGGEEGSSLIEAAILIPVLLMLLVGVVDFGRAFYLANEVAGAAQAGAIYGSQKPTDTTGMVNAATMDAPDVPGISATASYGCECWDGSGASANCSSVPSCATNLVYYVKVTATAPYQAMLPWPGIRTSMTLSRTVEMRAGSE